MSGARGLCQGRGVCVRGEGFGRRAAGGPRGRSQSRIVTEKGNPGVVTGTLENITQEVPKLKGPE
jgi:hypothetical protein